jgi:hypothetical protein
MREIAGSNPGLDFYILCEPIYVSSFISLYIVQATSDHTLMRKGSVGRSCRAI